MKAEIVRRIEQLKNSIAPYDEEAEQAARRQWDAIAKPLRGMGDFEESISRIAGMCGSSGISLSPAVLVLFCADNGVVEEGISQSGWEVTAAVAESIVKRGSSVCRMAKQAGVELCPVDMGMKYEKKLPGLADFHVCRGTKNFLKEPALSGEECLKAIENALTLCGELKEKGFRLIATGEMGIGNTSTSAALAAALLGLSVSEVTGRGAGLDDTRFAKKKRVIEEGLRKYGFDEGCVTEPGEVFKLLCSLGGADIAGMAGLFLGGAIYRMPVLIDGVISAVAALCAERIFPGCAAYMLASHEGREPAMKHLLKELKLSAPIHADLALGEGSGAVMCIPLLRMALAVYDSGASFDDLGMNAYENFDAREKEA